MKSTNASNPIFSVHFIAAIWFIVCVAVMGSVHGCIAEHERPFDEMKITAAALQK